MTRSDGRDEPARTGSRLADKPPAYSGERVRQGYIALNTPRRRRIFLSGLVGIVVLVILVALSL